MGPGAYFLLCAGDVKVRDWEDFLASILGNQDRSVTPLSLDHKNSRLVPGKAGKEKK